MKVKGERYVGIPEFVVKACVPARIGEVAPIDRPLSKEAEKGVNLKWANFFNQNGEKESFKVADAVSKMGEGDRLNLCRFVAPRLRKKLEALPNDPNAFVKQLLSMDTRELNRLKVQVEILGQSIGGESGLRGYLGHELGHATQDFERRRNWLKKTVNVLHEDISVIGGVAGIALSPLVVLASEIISPGMLETLITVCILSFTSCLMVHISCRILLTATHDFGDREEGEKDADQASAILMPMNQNPYWAKAWLTVFAIDAIQKEGISTSEGLMDRFKQEAKNVEHGDPMERWQLLHQRSHLSA